MSTSNPAKFVIPDVSTPRTYGIMNIVFASLLLLCNLGTAGWYLVAPTFKKGMEHAQAGLNAQIETSRKNKLDTLKRAVAAATAEPEKAKAQAAVAEFEALPKPPLNSMTMGFSASEDRRIVAFNLFDIAIAMILNLVMLISGVGLLRLKEGGRRAAVFVAGTKLVKLAIFLIVSLAFLIPLQSKLMEAEIAPVRAQIQGQPGGASAAFFMTPQVMAAISTSSVVLFVIIAAIYPILVLVMLTKPRVKAACQTAKASGLE
ncbi:MAG: hypothetical protein JWN86_4462 [Planctomycetota bacterium]|nr:hypothetical protein [Planctomycetota bacterium]